MSETVARLGPVRRRGLADEVADRVREGIFSGAYPPGAQLKEVELSADLAVSRGPVREALLRLEREGLVRTSWHRGATVTDLSARDVSELNSLRGALEDLAVREVVAHAPDSLLLELVELAADMGRTKDVHELVRRDIEFHDAVFAATGHRRLVEAWRALRCQVHLFLLTRIGRSTDGYLERVPAEHRELAALLRARDWEGALDRFAAHRRRAVEVLLDSAED